MTSTAARLRWALALTLLVSCEGSVVFGPLGAPQDTPRADDPGHGASLDGGRPGSDDNGESPSIPTTGADLPCDVENVLIAYCTGCHNRSPAKLAPMPLLTRADLLAAVPSDSHVSAGTQSVARMRSKTAPMPPGGNVPEASIAAFKNWVKAGMPAGTCNDNDKPTPMPFDAASTYSALSKVKTLLTGLPPTPDELAKVVEDPSALGSLIDGWMETPEFEARMLDFLQTAFQQVELTPEMLVEQLNAPLYSTPPALALLDNLKESFARTALEIIKSGEPFNRVVTTQSFMLTPALMSFLTLLDERHVDDVSNIVQTPAVSFDVRTEGTAIPFEQSIDPKSANFMHFTAIGATANCQRTTRTSTDNMDLFLLLMGRAPRTPPCRGSASTPIFTDADFSAWRMVRIDAATATSSSPRFYDLPNLRKVNALSLKTPRIGFFTTPSFFANWATNDSNQMRVTTNQTLIVALGASFDGSDSTVPITEQGLSAEHAAPGTACYACHKTLDPMRQFFKQALTLSYHEQRDPAQNRLSGAFQFDGVTIQGKGLGVLAKALADHPRFAEAWAQKLCYYANSSGCSADDPELLRVAGLFKGSNFDFKTLVRELFSSPLVTVMAHTKTFDDHDPVTSIARQSHLCTRLSLRLGMNDVCGIGLNATSATQQAAQVVATALPKDGYSRGSEIPVTLSDTSLFFRSSTEALCTTLAPVVVDATAGGKYTSTKVDDAVSDLVHNLMGLADGDPRAGDAVTILRGHYDAAVAGGAKPTDALRSTFVLACTAPSTVAIGL